MRATLIHDATVELDLDALRRWLRAPAASGAIEGDPGTGRQIASKPASVLVPIVARETELTVLFTRRTAHLRAHSGQISFPGGRAEPGDADAESTALRETHEEIGVQRAQIEVCGRLPEYHTRTGYRVTPVVGILRPPFQLLPHAHEVDEVFEVPLSFLLDPVNHQRHTREFEGRTITYYAMPWGGYYIWGATAGMLVNLYRQLAAGGGQIPTQGAS